MTKKECAEMVNNKSFHQIFELPEAFIQEMQKSGLYLAFCPDKQNLHVIGSHNEIIVVDFNIVDQFDVSIFTKQGEVKFHTGTDTLHKGTVKSDPGKTNNEPLIKVDWNQIENKRSGYILTASFAYEPVILKDDQAICSGMVFSKDDFMLEQKTI
jgi:hypothetical protein